MSRKRTSTTNPSDEVIARHVTELMATINVAVAAGCYDQRDNHPEQPTDPLPSLEDHYRAIGSPRSILPTRGTPHLRTRRATEPVAVALCHLINRGSFHGGDLPARCGDTRIAHRALLAAEAAGWIERGKYELSALQRFTGGAHYLPGTEWLCESRRWSEPPLGHHWITKTFKYLEVADVEQVLAEDRVTP